MKSLPVLLFLPLLQLAAGKIHQLALQDDARRNIVLTSFGYTDGGTFDLILSNFTVPDKITHLADSSNEDADKNGVIGFSLSRGASIYQSVGRNPRVCQLQQTDQGFDAIFFLLELPKKRLSVYRSGVGKTIRLCQSHEDCQLPADQAAAAPAEEEGKIVEKSAEAGAAENETANEKRDKRGILDNIKRFFSSNSEGKEYEDYVPLIQHDNRYSANISIRFTDEQRGKYHFIYHNCFNYREQGYSSRVAVDFSVFFAERNLFSYLSAGDLPKPHLFLYMSFCFFFAGILWAHKLCTSERSNVFRVHYLMTALVFLKALSLFFHGVNYYFVAKYGHQREIWALFFYITHLLKGALLFGTIVLIGTGYTFFKNFLTERDRKVFMVVLPLQIIDNIALIIIEESEFGDMSYQFWYQIFVFLDLICGFLVFFPIIWSMQHLTEGAHSDGKAAFNLEKLRIFRQFYLIVICFIYSTRIIKFLLLYGIPFDKEWVCDAVVEISTLFFFVVVGYKFRPLARNPYLKLNQEDSDDGDAFALTQSNLLENVVNRSRSKDDSVVLIDIPGGVGGFSSSDSDDEPTRKLIHPERTLL
ncbi:unnamed protein product, partial [Mesorhabditis spiculigera]